MIGTMVISAVATAAARAQDDVEVEERVELNRPAENPALGVEQARQRLQAAYKSQFDRWVMLQFQTRDGAGQQLEMLLAMQLRKLTADCRLREDQQKKIELAGRGDIKHFLDRFDFIARTMQNPRSSTDELRAAMGEMQPLVNSTRQRIFGDDSLLGKTLDSVLDPQQAAAREHALVERNNRRHQAAIASAARTLQSNLGLSDEQCSRLTQLLLSETRPPRRFGTAPEISLVLFQASRIPEDKLRPIFDDGQWRIMSRWMSVYIRGASGEKTLRNFGFVFDDERASGRADRVEPMARKEGTRSERTDQPRPGGRAP